MKGNGAIVKLKETIVKQLEAQVDWVPTVFWAVEGGKLVKYLREGGCCNCGDCCRGFKVSYTLRVYATSSGTKEGEPDLSEYEGYSIFYAQGLWLYFKITEVVEDDFECESLSAQGLCKIYGDPERFSPICRYWPFHPKDLENFPRCTFSFTKIEEEKSE